MGFDINTLPAKTGEPYAKSPKSRVHLLKNVQCDPTYTHVPMWDSWKTQTDYYLSHSIFETLQPFIITHQNATSGTMKLGIEWSKFSDDNINYMMFSNGLTIRGNNVSEEKMLAWYYCFIDNVRYISESTVEIDYTIDVMQTWFCTKDVWTPKCFIERNHVTDDTLFSNLVEEGLELGEYIVNAVEEEDINELSVCLLTVPPSNTDNNSTVFQGKVINKVYNGLNVDTYADVNNAGSMGALSDRINMFIDAGLEDAIVGLYEYPSFMGNYNTSTVQKRNHEVFRRNQLDGYTPKNNKLYSYPYNYLIVSNNSGQIAEYKWEDFVNPSGANFELSGTFLTTPCAMFAPYGYRHIYNKVDYDSGLTISNFPTCSFNGNAFKEWLAQNKGSLTLSALTTALTGTLSIGKAQSGLNSAKNVAKNVLKAEKNLALTGINVASEGFNLVGEYLAKKKDLEAVPSQVHGQVQCDSLNAGLNRYKFSIYHICCKQQFLKIIDEYFTLYGYAIHEMLRPDQLTHNRNRYTFVKTSNCVTLNNNAKLSVPNISLALISDVFNKGVTFWYNIDDSKLMGDYSSN